MKRLVVLLPIVVFTALFAGWIVARVKRAQSTLPSFAPARAPDLEPLMAPLGNARLAGRVVDPDGQGLAEVSVYARCQSVPHWTHTDEQGRFALEGLVEGEVQVALLAWGRAPTLLTVATGEVELVLPPVAPPPEPLPAMESAPLSGRIAHPLRRAWRDVDGYEVVLAPLADPTEFGIQSERRVRTDASGLFTLEGLALGSYALRVLPAWAEGADWPNLANPTYARLDHRRDPEGLVAVLAVGAIDVRVLGPDGRPLEGALLLLSPKLRPERVWPPFTSDADGAVRIRDLPPERYILTVRAGEAEVSEDVGVESGRIVTLELGPLAIRQR